MTLGAPRRLFFPPWLAERILYHEAGLLIVDKPPGIPVHGGLVELRESVVERLADYLSPDGNAYIGVHSRLDLGTSGVLLFTTDPERNGDVARAMEQGTLRRKYLGVVGRGPGSKLAKQGTIRVSLHHDGRKSRVDARGKAAVTHYRVLEESGERALVEFELETGRTHQIRASLVELGAALYGDSLYGGPRAPRLALHAHSLEGAPLPQVVRASLPLELERLWQEPSRDPSIEEVSRHVRDAITFRAPLATHTTALRWIDGEPDLLPGIVVEAWNERATLRAESFVKKEMRSGVRSALSEFGFEIEESENLGANPAPPGEGSQGSDLLPSTLVEAASTLNASEYGVTYPLNSSRPAFGLPIELRALRCRLVEGGAADQAEESRDVERRALNLFCGDGSLSRALAQSGMTTVNVDLSRAALNQARRALEPDSNLAHEFWQQDVRSYLEGARRDQQRFACVVLDPPAKTTRASPPLRIPSDYPLLLEGALAVLGGEGWLVFVARAGGSALDGFRRRLSARAEELGYVVIASEELSAGYDFRAPSRTNVCFLRVQAQRSGLRDRRLESRRRPPS